MKLPYPIVTDMTGTEIDGRGVQENFETVATTVPVLQTARGQASAASGNFATATVVTTGAGGDLALTITPAVTGLWDVRFLSIVRNLNAVWAGIAAQILITPADAESRGGGQISYVPHYLGVSLWTNCNTAAVFSLTARQTYSVWVVLTPEAEAWNFYTGTEYLMLTGLFVPLL